MSGDAWLFRAGDQVDVDRLIPGAEVERWTDPIRGRGDDGWSKPAFVNVPAPCCGRVFRRVPTSGDYSPMAFCCSCSLVFRLELLDDNDGGFTASFVVEEPRPLVVASHRAQDRT